LNGTRRAEVDRMLEGLGFVREPDLGRLIERYVGPAPITLQLADQLLQELHSSASAHGAPQRRGLEPTFVADSRRDEPDGTHQARSLDRDDGDRGQGVAQAVADENVLLRHENMAARSAIQSDQERSEFVLDEREALKPLSSGAIVNSSLSANEETRTPRALSAKPARDLQGTAANPRKAFLPDGLAGVDDLPSFPGARSFPTAKTVEEQRTVLKPAESALSTDAADSFEILVDEEILELEPEDSIDDEIDDA
jgi:hypothetical protein